MATYQSICFQLSHATVPRGQCHHAVETGRRVSRVRKDTNMIATQYSTASEATGCRHSATAFESSCDYRVTASGRFARGTVLSGEIHAQSPSFYTRATATV